MEYELHPRNMSWMELMPPHANASTRFVFACLEHCVLEAWQDDQGVVRLYLPESCGSHLVVGGPDDDLEPIDLAAGDPANGDSDALVRRPGAAWVTLLPGIRRTRKRPQSRHARTGAKA